MNPVFPPRAAAEPAPDSAYSWLRLALTLLTGTIACAGTWSVVVALPAVQIEFGTARAGASLPYTLTMIGFGLGSAVMGRIADRFGIMAPLLASALMIGAGFCLAGVSTTLWQFGLAHGLLIGLGASAGFAPLMADISHWFRKRRAFAVVAAAAGSYGAGTIWPHIVHYGITSYGWRATHIGIGLFSLAAIPPLAFLLRRRPSQAMLAAADQAAQSARADLGISARGLQLLLMLAGFACCVAMAMPQVHIVAYCGDLGYGVARGAEMLSLMLGLGIISRLASGVMADRIGGAAMLLLGSFMQALALALYLFFDGLASLYLISGLFGLFQGGIVPMYAVIIRDFLPPRDAGARIGMVLMATIFGMAFGGFISGVIFDLTASYRIAFLHGLAWNALNLAITYWLLMRPKQAALARA